MARRISPVVALWLLLVALAASASSIDDATAAKSRGDFVAAFGLFKTLANAGDAAAQFELSLLYLNGKGVRADTRQAMHWLKQSAVSGYQPAQSNLGVAFNRGRYLAQDAVKAYVWSSIAALGGDSVAVTNRDVAARKFSPQELVQVKALALECRQRFAEIRSLPACL